MNQTFDLTRCNNYFAYFLKTGVRKHIAIVGALLGFALLMVVAPVVLFNAYDHPYTHALGSTMNFDDPMASGDTAIFDLMLVVIMCVSASMMFSDFGDKASRLDALMLPASALEKFIVRWIVFVPATAIVCIAGFELIDIIRYICVYLKYQNPVNLHLLGIDFFKDNIFESGTAMIYLNLCIALYVLGSIVWPKLSLVKTFAVYILLSMVYGWWGMLVMGLMPSYYYNVSEASSDMLMTASNIVVLIVTLVVYVIAYYRLKEIELVQRW